MLNLRRTREPRGKRHAKATGSFPLRLVGDCSGLRPTQTASGFPSTPSARFPLITLLCVWWGPAQACALLSLHQVSLKASAQKPTQLGG